MDRNNDSVEETNQKNEKGNVTKQYVAAIICSLLAFMYGHSIGWSSSAVPQLEEGLLSEGPVSPEQSGWIGGTYCLGALVSAPFHGLIADARGRKFAAYLIAVGFAIKWILILAFDSFTWILVARAIGGAAGAGSITVVSIYNSEIADPRLRSSLGGIMALLYASGIFCAFVLGAYLSYQTVAIIYLSVSLIWFPMWWFMPESPTHLILHNKEKEGVQALQWLLGGKGSLAQQTLIRLKVEHAGAISAATIKQFFSDPAARRGTLYSITLISLQTFCGIFAIHNYASSIFGRAGGLTPATGTMIYGAFMVIGSIVPPFTADRAPRKTLLFLSSVLLCIGTATFGTYELLNSMNLLSDTNTLIAWIPAITLSGCVFVYCFGLGSVTYICINELFSDENRGIAGGVVAITIWITSFLLIQFFGTLVRIVGDYAVFFMFSGICALGAMFIHFILPETRGKSMPEIQAILRIRATGEKITSL